MADDPRTSLANARAAISTGIPKYAEAQTHHVLPVALVWTANGPVDSPVARMLAVADSLAQREIGDFKFNGAESNGLVLPMSADVITGGQSTVALHITESTGYTALVESVLEEKISKDVELSNIFGDNEAFNYFVDTGITVTLHLTRCVSSRFGPRFTGRDGTPLAA